MRNRMWTCLAALSGAGVVLGVMAAPASAASGGGSGPGAAHRMPPGTPARALSHAGRAGVVNPASAPDARAVCQAMKVGYAACMALVRTNTRHYGGVRPDATPPGYGPSDLQSAYNLPPGTAGSGETVAIVDAYDDPNAEADLQVYRAQYGLPVCDTANGCFQKLNQDGQASPLPPAAGSVPGSFGWDAEESLDMDMVSAICPNCHIILVEANSNANSDLYTAEDAAVATGAKFVSNSWASCEYSGETTDDAHFNHPGVVITAAGGDYAYDNQQQNCTTPSYPAASQYVTSVGGTSLTQDPSSPRGWDETAWPGTGSGCSQYEAKPAWQADTGCLNRTTDDVSAVADPNTGVAVYDTYSQAGWAVYGGTSVATPIAAATYALAGTPVPGTYPASYPYDHPSGLNDVTTGSDGSCDPLYLCTAGTGYDGPTGLGTPDGTSAFALGPHGEVTGRVVTSRGNRPLPGAEVDVGDTVTRTAADGSYTATVPAGSYQVTARLPGYAEQTVPAVSVGDGQAVTENFTLRQVPDTSLSGTVSDGSGHGWALYAKVQVLGGGPVTYTDPATGRYSLQVPEDNSYRLEVAPVAAGYQPLVTTAQVGAGPATRDVSAPVDTLACDAPGYAFTYQGSTQRFNGTTVPRHWAVVNNNGTTLGWEFDNPGGIGNETGGSGGFAIAAAGYPNRVAMDTSLQTPVVNMTGYQSPVVQFDTDLPGVPGRVAGVDLSTDGGDTWTTVWQQAGSPGIPGPSRQVISLPQAAGQARVQVRFHYIDTSGGQHWSLDNVFLGNRPCTPLPGGLVTGTVTDANTGSGIDGATVRGPGVRTVTAAMPADPHLPHGYYSLFTPSTGAQEFTATRGAYVSQAASVDVTASQTTQANFTLQAGLLKVTPGSIDVHLPAGHSRTVPVTISNTGHAPVKVTLREEAGDSAPAPGAPAAPARHGAPLRRVHGRFSPLPGVARPSPGGGQSAAPAARTPAAGAAAWTAITGYPTPVMGNAVATDTATGTVYSFGGYNGYGSSGAGYTYSPGTGQWSAAASMDYPREEPAGAIIGGKIYVTGGWDIQRFSRTVLIPQTEIYNTATGTWSQGASMPEPTAAPGVAVLNGRMYVIGGCAVGTCGQTQVQVYDPSANTWTSVAPYPEPVAWESCGAVTGKIYCAGGATSTTTSTADAFSYNPATNTWTKIASLPIDLWGSGYVSSAGQLLISGGVTSDGTVVTNQGYAYNPLAGTWSALPGSINTVYGGGSSCGFYKIGGLSGGFPSEVAEQLPGYHTCGPVNVPWVSESSTRFALSPGQRVTVRVTVRASSPGTGQPGTYTAAIDIGNATPYQVPAVPVTLHVTPGT